jgi:hypothetical protein
MSATDLREDSGPAEEEGSGQEEAWARPLKGTAF